MLGNANIFAFLHSHVVGHYLESLGCCPPKLLVGILNARGCCWSARHTHGFWEHVNQLFNETLAGTFNVHDNGFVPLAIDLASLLQVVQPLVEGLKVLLRFFPHAWFEFWGCCNRCQLTCCGGKIRERTVSFTQPLSLTTSIHAAETATGLYMSLQNT